ncbi:unnamed protein product [Phytomonas sp. Hart1]|nr:unnamed protein product [Phytomonas sp. Hart1]|eukprot:CCW71248.1 unnamed protein product [Phytomonas sp. isolate Hart1]
MLPLTSYNSTIGPEDLSDSNKSNLSDIVLTSRRPHGQSPTACVSLSVADFDPEIFNINHTTLTGFSLPLSWHNLTYRVGNKQVLDNLTGTALSGRCLAIMGSSGSGKTTFLSAISDRLTSDSDGKLSGSHQLGDIEYEPTFRKAIGFVPQDEIISSMVTPYDAMWFSLRTRHGTSCKETHKRVMEMLNTLKLLDAKDTVVGVPGMSTCLSGGERKRCSIGTELICDPKVLLLDEPTSALDSVTSAKIIQQLRELARLGRTVIYTIHQPTAEVLSYFDDLMLLTGGRCAYHGTMADSLGYFESIGFKCPKQYTAGDYFMMLLQDEPTARVLVERWAQHLKSSKRTPHTTSIRVVTRRKKSIALEFLDLYIKKFKSSMYIQFSEVFVRRFNELRRDRAFIFALFVQTLYFSLVAGLIFLRLGMDTLSIQDRQGLFYTILSNRSMGSIYAVLSSFHKARVLFFHDRNSGAYSSFIYLAGTLTAQMPLMFFLCFIESIIVYFLTGLYVSVGAFLTYFCVMLLYQEVCVGIGVLLSTYFESLTLATTMVALINLPFIFASGLFASTDRLRPYFYVFEKLSYIRHAYIILLRNELKHIDHFNCDIQKYGELFCRNQPHNGREVLVQLGFDSDPQSTNLLMWLSLGFMWIIVRILTIIGLMIISRLKK